MLNVTCSSLCITGTAVDVRNECLRKLSSQMPMFELDESAEQGTCHWMNADSEVCVESNAHLFGIHPFYIPRGQVLVLI